MLKLLIVDDDQDISSSIAEFLQSVGHEVEVADSAELALTMMRKVPPDVLLADIRMEGMSGMDLLIKVKDYFPTVTPVLMTAQGTIDSAIKAMRNGAFDYLLKPFSLEQLEHLIGKIVEYRKLNQENTELRDRIDLLTAPSVITTQNERMKKILDTAHKVAVTDASVLITGESGTGKTLLAKIIHDNSPRAEGPFAVVNCATISENLLESELFGHIRGSFTGAVRDKVGRLQAANTGTVFLDEIGEISPGLQTKLLRFLQEREFERVGDTKTIKVDVRIIAATNKNLEKDVAEGRFREDLYFRLNVIELRMPALRERKEDLKEFTDHLLAQSFATVGREPRPLSAAARKAIQDYSWPGNIRELKNALERAAILCATDEVTVDDLPDRVQEGGGSMLEQYALGASVTPINGAPAGQAAASGSEEDGMKSLDELEKEHIQRVLASTKTLEEAAGILGINLSTLWRKRKQYALDENGQVA